MASKLHKKWQKSLAEKWKDKATRCEICGIGMFLTAAHSKKRRFIKTEAEFREIAILCVICYQEIERLPHDEMEARVKAIIEAR